MKINEIVDEVLNNDKYTRESFSNALDEGIIQKIIEVGIGLKKIEAINVVKNTIESFPKAIEQLRPEDIEKLLKGIQK